MKLLKRQPILFLLLFILVVLLPSSLFLSNIIKGDATIFFNNLELNSLDLLMPIITLFGEWFGVLLAIGLVVHKQKKQARWFLVALLLGMLIVYMFKHQIYKGEPRPFNFLEQGSLRQIGEVILRKRNSFPSGHTFTAFLCAYAVAFSYKKKWIQIVSLFIAVSVGISRLYLGQHFLQDVIAGSLLAVVLGLIINIIFQYLPFNKQQV